MIKSLELFGDIIEFSERQSEFISAVLNDDLTLKENHYKEFAFFGGYRSGKSFLVQLVVFLLCLIYPGLRVVYVRRTYDQLKDSVIAQFNDLEKGFIKYNQYEYIEHAKEASRVARFKNGSTIRFRAFDRDTNILSAEYDIAAMCQAEEIQEELYLQLWGRLSGRIMPKALLFAEGNPANTWAKRKYKDPELKELEEKGIYFLNVTTEENPFIDPTYIENLKLQYPERWLRRNVYGEWESIDEMVFSEFRESMHVVEPISFNKEEYKTYKIAMGGDYGYRNPAAFLWAYKDYDDNVTIFDEYYKSEQQIEDIARNGLFHGKFPCYYDFSAKRPDRDGNSVWNALAREGMMLIEGNKDEINNINTVNTLFKKNKLSITRNCINLIKEIKNYKWQPDKLGSEKNSTEKPIDKDNHAIDSMLYLLNGMRVKKSIDPKIIAERNSLRALTQRPPQRSAIHYG